jgi:heme-degrading monooxygenase HmoA
MGSRARPGAFSLTALQVRSDEEAEDVGTRAQEIAAEMLGLPGFVGLLLARIGHRMLTIAAWESAEGPELLLGSHAHREAARAMYQKDLGTGGMLSVWTPERVRMLVRCEECGEIVELEEQAAEALCPNGHPLPAHPPYW